MASQPIVFVSHFSVKAGHGAAVRQMWDSVAADLEATRPRTAAYLAFLNEAGDRLSIVHVFPDADAMAAHAQGAGERSRAAYEHFSPGGWEIYGRPHEAELDMMQQGAEAAGVDLSVEPEALGGFLRTTAS
jgi:predicted aminopeptidase